MARQTKKYITKTGPDLCAVFDGRLSASYQQGVIDSLNLYNACLTERFWLELRVVVALFIDLQRRHAANPAIKQRARWRRIIKIMDETGQALGLKDAAGAYVVYYDVVTEAFRARGNPDLWYLCTSLLDIWTCGLGREARFSTGGRPSGPLIRFIQACIDPLLVYQFNPHTIRSYIERYNTVPRRVTLPGLRFIFSTSRPTVASKPLWGFDA
jgi:hypothetical protein